MGRINDLLNKRYQKRTRRLPAVVQEVPFDANGRPLGYILCKIGSQTNIKVYTGINDVYYPGDYLSIEQYGEAAAADYVAVSYHGGIRPDSGIYEFPDDTVITGGETGPVTPQTFAAGDLVFGNPNDANWWFDYSSGIMYLRSGASNNGNISSSGTITLGASTVPYLFLSSSGIQFKDSGSVMAGMNASSFFIGASSGVNGLYYNNGSLIVDGTIYANSGSFSGAIYADSGSFSGAIYATSGSFSGTINATGGSISGDLNVGSVTPYVNISGASALIQSSNYASGTEGWRIFASGAEFENITARGSIKTAVFEKSLITAFAGGQVIAKSAAVLAGNCTVENGVFGFEVYLQSGDEPFESTDIIYFKNDISSTYAVIFSQNGDGLYEAIFLEGNSSATYYAGETVIDYGPSGYGKVYLAADQTNSPYLSIATHQTSGSDPVWTERVRLGNLGGIASACDGYGLWTDNGFFSGTVYASAGSFTGLINATSGSFTGTIYAESGSFAGTVKATAGCIGGWNIGTGSITSTSVGMATPAGDATYAFWAGSDTPANAEFFVTHTGSLRTTSGCILGTVVPGPSSSINGKYIIAETIAASNISASAITTDKLTASAITADVIKAGAITATTIAASAITSEKISANAITAGTIAASAITATKIAANAVTSATITASAVTADKIAANSVTSDKISVTKLSALAADMGSLTAGSIVIGTTNKIWLNDSGDGALAIGGATKGTAPFRVTSTGGLTATTANISGSISAISASFNNSVAIGSGTPYILITGSTAASNTKIGTSDFVSNTTGWQIDGAGNAEFNNVTARGSIRTAVFEKSLVTAFAGSQMVSKSSSVLASTCTLSDTTFTLVVKKQAGGAPFADGDLIYIKTETKHVYATVDAGSESGNNWSYTATYKSGDTSGTFYTGETVVDFGPDTAGRLLLTADSACSPYLSIATHDMGASPAWTERARLGNLGGITSACDGYGLWTDNGYFTGVISAQSGSISGSLMLGTDGGIYQGTETFSSPSTGLKIWNDNGIGRIAGFNSTASQWGGDTEGKFRAGGVLLDADGITLVAENDTSNHIKFKDGAVQTAKIYSFIDSSDSDSRYTEFYAGDGDVNSYLKLTALGTGTNISSVLLYSDDDGMSSVWSIANQTKINFGSNTGVVFKIMNNTAASKFTVESTGKLNALSASISGSFAATSASISGSIGGTNETLSGSIGAVSACLSGSIGVGTNVRYSGSLVGTRGGTAYTGYMFVPSLCPIQNASFLNRASVATGTSPLDLSANWTIPGSVKAVAVRASFMWANAGNGNYALIRPKDGSYGSVVCRSNAAGIFNDSSGIVPCDSNGDIEVVIGGTAASLAHVEIWGYYI